MIAKAFCLAGVEHHTILTIEVGQCPGQFMGAQSWMVIAGSHSRYLMYEICSIPYLLSTYIFINARCVTLSPPSHGACFAVMDLPPVRVTACVCQHLCCITMCTHCQQSRVRFSAACKTTQSSSGSCISVCAGTKANRVARCWHRLVYGRSRR